MHFIGLVVAAFIIWMICRKIWIKLDVEHQVSIIWFKLTH